MTQGEVGQGDEPLLHEGAARQVQRDGRRSCRRASTRRTMPPAGRIWATASRPPCRWTRPSPEAQAFLDEWQALIQPFLDNAPARNDQGHDELLRAYRGVGRRGQSRLRLGSLPLPPGRGQGPDGDDAAVTERRGAQALKFTRWPGAAPSPRRAISGSNRARRDPALLFVQGAQHVVAARLGREVILRRFLSGA